MEAAFRPLPDEAGVETRSSCDTKCNAPYDSSEVIHDLVPKPESEALERERGQIVNNFAVSASAGYELAPPPR